MSVDDAKMQGEVDFNPSQDRNAASDQAQNGHVSEQPISNVSHGEEKNLQDQDTKLHDDNILNPFNSALQAGDINFKSADIGKKQRTNFFVKVGADDRRTQLAKKRAEAERKKALRIAAKTKKRELRKIKQEKHRARRKAFFAVFFKGKRKLITIPILVIIIGGGCGYLVYQKINADKLAEAARQAAEQSAAAEAELKNSTSYSSSVVTQKARDEYEENGLAAGNKCFDDAIQASTDTALISSLYFRRSVEVDRIFGADQKQQVIDDALKAESTSASYATANWLASLYLKYGDSAQSKKYQDLATQRLEEKIKSNPTSSEGKG